MKQKKHSRTCPKVKARKAPAAGWRHSLAPFGDAVYRLHGFIWERIQKMSDDQLNQLLADCEQPTTTNCGWGMYDAAQRLKSEIQICLHGRKTANNDLTGSESRQ